jgi:predicted phage terminase large subunit-like protein
MSSLPVLQAVLRLDFYSFVERTFREVAPGEAFSGNWHIEAMCHALVGIGTKATRRQIIEVPPRSLKTICSSVALVAWLLGHDPTRKIICVSYSQELAALFSAMTRRVMKSEWYKDLFPGTVISAEKDTERYFRTTAGGYRDSTSVGGTLTGKGADLIIIDDPSKPEEASSEAQRTSVNDWFDRTLVTRLNNKRTDGILIVMQRLHAEDLAGHVRSRDKWDILTIPAIAVSHERTRLGDRRWHERLPGDVIDPSRDPRDILDSIKTAIGSYAFSAQYQQEPLPADGSVIEWSWFRSYDTPPDRSAARVVQSWDCASKNTEFSDYSVCTTWAIVGHDYYLLDMFRRRLNFPELLAAVIAEAERHSPAEILIEDAAAGIQLCQYLRLERPTRMPEPKAVKPERDKVTRAHTISHVIEQGRVFLPINAPWLEGLRTELIQFPFGRHDDQIDSITQFLGRVEAQRLRGAAVQVVPMFAGRSRRTR